MNKPKYEVIVDKAAVRIGVPLLDGQAIVSPSLSIAEVQQLVSELQRAINEVRRNWNADIDGMPTAPDHSWNREGGGSKP